MNKFYLGVIAILVAIIFFQRACTPKCVTALPKTDTVYIVKHDTIVKEKLVPQSVTSYEGDMVGVTEHDTIFQIKQEFVDTISTTDSMRRQFYEKTVIPYLTNISNDYFSTRFYKDSYETKYGIFHINDSITQNKIRARNITADWKIPVAQTTVSKNQVYLGLDIGSNGKNLGFGPNIQLKTKTDQLYNVGATYLPGDVGMYYHIGFAYKLHF